MFRQNYVDVVKPEYTALCGCHVRKLASILAIIGLAFSILGFLTSIINPTGFLSNGIGIVIYSLVLYADKASKPGGYLPYLIFSAIGLVILAIIILALVCFMIAIPFLPPDTWQFALDSGTKIDDIATTATPHKEKISPAVMEAMVGVALLFICLLTLISVYLWRVNLRAYRYMNEEVLTGNVQQNTANIEFGGVNAISK